MKHAVLLFWVSLVSVSAGCVATPTDDAFWGPGVTDPGALHRNLEAAIADGLTTDSAQFSRGRYSVMTWDQAATIYRNASSGLKSLMCHDLLDGRRFKGMSRGQVIALVGEPDGRDEGEHGDVLIYTGAGYVSDAMSGCLLNFDADGTFRYIGYAN